MAFGFKMGDVKPGNFFNHPPLGQGDILRLKEIFPDHVIWNARTSDIGNVYYPTDEEALAFLESLREYRETHELSDENYSTSGIHPEIVSNLKSVFDDLIPFFEHELAARAV